mmetsp:Transcript_33636/g.69457  ORF Transcript_33636/g.69457 Transcript_33636/m.69457 type:complete len:294 (-) Transcript_33636:760-1641(-)
MSGCASPMVLRALSVMRSKSCVELRPCCTNVNCVLKETSSMELTSSGLLSPISASSCSIASSFFSETTLSRMRFCSFSFCSTLLALVLSVLECSSRAFSSALDRISLNPNAMRSHIPRSNENATAGNRSCLCNVPINRKSLFTIAWLPPCPRCINSSSSPSSATASPDTILFPNSFSASTAFPRSASSCIHTTSSPLTSVSYCTASGLVTNWKLPVKNSLGSRPASLSARNLIASPSFARRTTADSASHSESESLGSNFKFAGIAPTSIWPAVKLASGCSVSSLSAQSSSLAL